MDSPSRHGACPSADAVPVHAHRPVSFQLLTPALTHCRAVFVLCVGIYAACLLSGFDNLALVRTLAFTSSSTEHKQ